MDTKWTTAILAIAITCLVMNSSAQDPEKLMAQNPCTSKTTCRDCIQTKSCAWCFQPDFGDRPRCYQPSFYSPAGGCAEEYTINMDNTQYLEENLELSKGSAGGAYIEGQYSEGHYEGHYEGMSGAHWQEQEKHRDVVQIRPQKATLKLRINEVHKMNIQYSQAEDYPVDLYYLMDLSKSMEDDKEKLSALGTLLSESMRNITSNFRLGFGSFVDKVVMPYVSTVPRKLEKPCDSCEAPYGFRNRMPLSTDTKMFSHKVKAANVSGNLDAPEGGFDAIMQAIVCRRAIGWREKARRLLVFSTDAGFHYAGDGKLGGIVKPNDGLCHLDEYGSYTYSSFQDYPSISQLNLKVKENAINVIFAVTAEQISVYERLKEHIEGSTAGQLSNDSSNVVDLVKNQYDKITSSVEMKDNSTSAVKITYYSSCLDEGPAKQTSKCDGLKVGNVVTFSAEIVVTSCPEDPREWNQVFQIYPVGINESLIINLEMQCDCPCERPGHSNYERQSPICHGHGTHACGICECDSMFFGRMCECSAQDVHNNVGFGSTRSCRPDNVTTVDCSNRGQCICGQCDCEKRTNPEELITGSYCECDNFSCDRHNGLLCSGEDHGRCECGSCECHKGWSGNACDCRATNDTCIPHGGGEVCSGHGDCVCGQCVCHLDGEERYSGRYCDKCPTCPGRCEEFKDCVQCQTYKKGRLTEEECASNCTQFVPHEYETIEVNEEDDENLCAYYDEDGCRYTYVYSYNEQNKVVIRAQKRPECKAQIFMLGIVLAVIAAIVLIGMAILMLWKIFTSISDRREFAKFEKERMMAKWDTGENPIYKQATSTFKNPTYAGK